MNSKTTNQYSVTFYNSNLEKEKQRVMFIQYCHKAKYAIAWVNKKGIIWTHCNVWHRKTNVFVEQIKNE